MGKHRHGEKSSKKHRSGCHDDSPSPRRSSKHHISHRHNKSRERSTERVDRGEESSSKEESSRTFREAPKSERTPNRHNDNLRLNDTRKDQGTSSQNKGQDSEVSRHEERRRRFRETLPEDRSPARHKDNFRLDNSQNEQGTSSQNNGHDAKVFAQKEGRRRYHETPPEERSLARDRESRTFGELKKDEQAKKVSRHHSSESKHEERDRKRRHNKRDTSNQGRSSKRHPSQERHEINETSSVDKTIPWGFEEDDAKHRISGSTMLHLRIPYVKQVTYCNLEYEKKEEPKYIYIRGEDGMRQARNYIDDASIKGAQLNYDWNMRNYPEEERPETSFYYWTGHRNGRFFSSPECVAPIQELEEKFDVSIEKVSNEPDVLKISGGFFREVKEELDNLAYEYYLTNLFEEIEIRTDLVNKMTEQGFDLPMLKKATDTSAELSNAPGLIQTLTLFGLRDNLDQAIKLIEDIAKQVDPRGEDTRVYVMELSLEDVSELMGEKEDEDEKLLKIIENTAGVTCYLDPEAVDGYQSLTIQGDENSASNAAALVVCVISQGAKEVTASEAKEYMTEVRVDY